MPLVYRCLVQGAPYEIQARQTEDAKPSVSVVVTDSSSSTVPSLQAVVRTLSTYRHPVSKDTVTRYVDRQALLMGIRRSSGEE